MAGFTLTTTLAQPYETLTAALAALDAGEGAN